MESIIVVVERIMNLKEAEIASLNERRTALAGLSAGKEEKQGFFSRLKGKKKGK